MKLHKIVIKGYKRHKETELIFSDASFLIGENNVGKTSALEAVELLLSDSKKVDESLFYLDENGDSADSIVLDAEFRDIGEEAKHWRGFKGRLFPYQEGTDTKFSFFYRKTFSKTGSRKVEAKSLEKKLKPEFDKFNT
ncbi:AAA family ATPase, partial [Acinetobacter baumannii]